MSEQGEQASAGLPAATGAAANAGAATGAAKDATTGTPGAAPGTAAQGSAGADGPGDFTGQHRPDLGSTSEGVDEVLGDGEQS